MLYRPRDPINIHTYEAIPMLLLDHLRGIRIKKPRVANPGLKYSMTYYLSTCILSTNCCPLMIAFNR